MWKGTHFHPGKYKEVFDAEVFAIRRALRILEERNEIGASYTLQSLPIPRWR